METNVPYSPWSQLPAPEPRTVNYKADHFYENTAKHLIKDAVRIMSNGLHIDLERVIELEDVLEDQLNQVSKNLAKNKYIKQYLESRYKSLIDEYVKDRKSKLRSSDYYLKPFKHGDMTHRSYFMTEYAKSQGISLPKEMLPTGVPKWEAKLVKKLSASRPLLRKLLDKTLSTTHPLVSKAMHKLAADKAEIYNSKYVTQIHKPVVDFPKFNPASSQQKQELFAMLNIDSPKTSKDTGLPSFSRDVIEEINKVTTDEHIKDLTQQFIDHSFAAIVRNNFINAFYKYTVDSRLYGTYKLLGAKSARFTSSGPNMLNMPSTGSIFAKPIKRCFTAPEGKVTINVNKIKEILNEL